MKDYEHVDVEFTRYDVEVSYKCPRCGHEHTMKPTTSNIYWFLEGGVEAECDNCGVQLYLWEA